MVQIIDQKDQEIKDLHKSGDVERVSHQNNKLSQENTSLRNQYTYDQDIISQLQSQLNELKSQGRNRVGWSRRRRTDRSQS